MWSISLPIYLLNAKKYSATFGKSPCFPCWKLPWPDSSGGQSHSVVMDFLLLLVSDSLLYIRLRLAIDMGICGGKMLFQNSREKIKYSINNTETIV